jgi:hypothetical protein
MTLQIVPRDIQAATFYWPAKCAGEDYALGDSEVNLSAYVTSTCPQEQYLLTVHDGFADGMREARNTSISNIRDTFKLIKGEAA